MQGRGEEGGTEPAEDRPPSRHQLSAGCQGWLPAQSQHEKGHSGGQRDREKDSTQRGREREREGERERTKEADST